MENNLSLHLKMFNDKVKLMNQSQSKQLLLTANEARNLHADIFDLMNQIATLSQELSRKASDTVVSVVGMDGGTY
jgi:hypothetical protein